MYQFTKGIFDFLIESISQRLQGLSNAYKLFRIPKDKDGIEEFDVYVNGYPYFFISNITSSIIRIKIARSPYDIPLYSVSIQSHLIQFFKNGKSVGNIEWGSIHNLIDSYFTFPDKMRDQIDIICKEANDILGLDVTSENVEYDLRTGKYFFIDWSEKDGVENCFWRNYFEVENQGTKEVALAKYTSFNTLIKTLQSGKIRMNSIIGMNDRSELNFIYQFLNDTGYISEFNRNTFEPYFEANNRFITSFSENIDDLNMWRLYGNNLEGVCMVFKYLSNNQVPFLYRICYVDDNTETPANKVKKFLDILKKSQIDFSFNSLKQWQNFFKSKSYSYENEHRLLLNENKPDGWMFSPESGILTPYIEKPLKQSLYSQVDDDHFPLYLSEVILGSKMKGKEENVYQLYRMCEDLKLPYFSVSISKEKTYR